jgi:hypothetical protein
MFPLLLFINIKGDTMEHDIHDIRNLGYQYENFPGFPLAPDKSLVRGDILRFRYTSKDDKFKKINVDPCIIFSGANLSEGWIEGPNIFLFNYYYTSDGRKEVNKMNGTRFLALYKAKYWDTQRFGGSGEKQPFIQFTNKNLEKLFGNLGKDLRKYWRRFHIPNIKSATNINIDLTEKLLDTQNPIFADSLVKINEE